ncbi:MAG: tRNA (adenosine(37)-N6)-dimethylallyltransferase MiaA [Elusimicrobiota bacterium]
MPISKQKILITLVGPTASGKTAVAVALAKRMEAEIISADSRQIYRYLNIGSAKPTPQELAGVPCHLIDFLEPDQTYSAGQFRQAALKNFNDIFARGKIPLLVGGTGLYVRAVVDGLCPAPPRDNALRQQLEAEARQFGRQHLYDRLKAVDLPICEKIHPHNLPRIIRALEVYLLSGTPLSTFQKEFTQPLAFPVFSFGLDWNRKKLYQRIDLRVERMLTAGWVDEVRGLLSRGYNQNSPGLLGLGYPQITAYLTGKCPLEEAVRLIKRDSRHYAKRQLTWFKKDRRIQWMDVNENFSTEETAERVEKKLKYLA